MPNANCLNFPYFASILAGRRGEDGKYRLATGVAAPSLLMRSSPS
jgi:hypothetical protein